jgi:ABC-type transport system involved in multi-copper enzyme maturation permease subunit
LSNVLAIAAKEVREGMRNRWVLAAWCVLPMSLAALVFARREL